jgi:hypothetical protein
MAASAISSLVGPAAISEMHAYPLEGLLSLHFKVELRMGEQVREGGLLVREVSG